jgi:hypothetical protein
VCTLWSYLLKKSGNVYFRYFRFPILSFANLFPHKLHIYLLQTEMKVICFILSILCWILAAATSLINMSWWPTQRYVVDKARCEVHRCSVMYCNTTICKRSLSLHFPLYFHSQYIINWGHHLRHLPTTQARCVFQSWTIVRLEYKKLLYKYTFTYRLHFLWNLALHEIYYILLTAKCLQCSLVHWSCICILLWLIQDKKVKIFYVSLKIM